MINKIVIWKYLSNISFSHVIPKLYIFYGSITIQIQLFFQK